MSKVKIVLDKKGLTELRQQPEMLELVKKTANEQWGDREHHHIRSFIGYDRAKALLYINTERYPS